MGNTQNRPQASEERGGDQERSSSSSSSSTDFTCEICTEPTPSNNKFNSNDDHCVHSFCLECISMYIQTKVQDHNASNIPCPALNCKTILDPITVRHIVPPAVFDKWCDNLCNSAVLELRTCYCPYADCSVMVANECGRTPKKTACPNCKRLFCFNCNLRWHEGYSCREVQSLRDDNDMRFLDLVMEKQWNSCPTCGHSVDRIGGCARVRCRCGTSFCHGCRSKYECMCQHVIENLNRQYIRTLPYVFALAIVVAGILLLVALM